MDRSDGSADHDGLEELDDLQLTTLVRDGNLHAFGVLFDRHRVVAERYSRHLGLGADAADVVSEAFAVTLDLLTRGKGPDTAFRAYLLTAIRHEAGRRAKERKRVVPTDETAQLDTPVPFATGSLIDPVESAIVRQAYESLPKRWRTVLWALDVEGRTAREVAEMSGMKSNSISALAYRARTALRESYLRQHSGADRDLGDAECAAARKAMASVVRGAASHRQRHPVLSHIRDCHRCHQAFEELQDLNRDIGHARLEVVLPTFASGLILTVSGWFKHVAALGEHLASAGGSAMAAGAMGVAALVPAATAASPRDVPDSVPAAIAQRPSVSTPVERVVRAEDRTKVVDHPDVVEPHAGTSTVAASQEPVPDAAAAQGRSSAQTAVEGLKEGARALSTRLSALPPADELARALTEVPTRLLN